LIKDPKCLKGPKEFFDWFVDEVISFDETTCGEVASDVLTTSCINLKFWELGKNNGLKIKFEEKGIDICIHDKSNRRILAFEHENHVHPSHPEIENLKKIETELKVGVFYSRFISYKGEQTGKELTERIEKYKNVTSLKKRIEKQIGKPSDDEKWLIIIGVGVYVGDDRKAGKPANYYYYGYTLNTPKNTNLIKIGEKLPSDPKGWSVLLPAGGVSR